MASARVFCVVVSKLGYQKESSPVILLEVHKNSKVRFYGAVLSLSLTVSLREKSSRKPPLNAKKVVER